MTAKSLVAKLEELGLVEPKILKKLQKQINNPEKKVSAKKILSFLVKNDLLTKSKAIALKKELENGAAEEAAGLPEIVEPELPEIVEPGLPEIVEPAASRQTDELVAGVASSSAVVTEEVASHPNMMEGDESATIFGDQLNPAEFGGGNGLNGEPDYAAPMPEAVALDDPMESWDDGMQSPQPASRGVGFDGKIDSSDQWATKWVFVGFAMLGLLLIVGSLLYFMLAGISAEDRYEAANQSFENQTYGDAVKQFGEFLEKHPSHEKAPSAKVTRVEAMLNETYRQRNWDETIVRARRELALLVDDESIEWDGIRNNLAVWLPNSTLEIAKRATKQESRSGLVEQLAKARDAKQLVDDKVYIPNSIRKKERVAKALEQIDEEIAKGEVLINKQDQFDSTLVNIAAFREQGETDKAFDAYNQLIRAFGDLRADERLQAEMRQVSQIEAKLVTAAESNIQQHADWRASPIESTTVLASQTGEPIESLSGEIITVLADAAVYGIDAGDGSVKWRRFVGYQTRIQPIPIDAEHVLIADQLNHDLVKVTAKDGRVVWRNEIGEPFLTPQVDEDMILLTAESGNLFKLDRGTGGIVASAKIPQTVNVPMIRSARNGLIYQLGFYSNLYILSEEDLSCQDVFYLGHYRGSVAVPPVVWNNFVIVAVNDSGICDLQVLRPNPETGVMEPVQNVIRVTRGIVTNPLVRFGRFMLINSETGDLKMLEMNTAEETNPIRTLAEEKFENSDAARTYVATAGSQLWVGARGMILYKVSRSQGTFKRQKIANANDYFVGPIRKFGDSIIHVRKRSGSAHISISAVDGETLQQIWRTEIGGPVAGPPVVVGGRMLAISSQGDLFTPPESSQGDSVVRDVAKSSNIIEDLLFERSYQLTEDSWSFVGPPGSKQILHLDAASGRSKLVRLSAPADNAASAPIRVGEHLVFATRSGQVVRVDPLLGRNVGTPFLPAVSPGTVQNWKQPVLINETQFVVADETDFYLIDASSPTLLQKAGELASGSKLLSEVVTDGSNLFGVMAGETAQKMTSIQINGTSLTLGASVDLPARLQDGPWAIGDRILIRLDDGKLACFDSALNSQWSTDVPAGTLAAEPQLDGNSVRVYFSAGKSLALNLGTGEIESEFDLGQPIVHQPVISGGKVIVAGLDGTLHQISTPN